MLGRRRTPWRHEGNDETSAAILPELTPLIDVAFLLLIVLLVNAAGAVSPPESAWKNVEQPPTAAGRSTVSEAEPAQVAAQQAEAGATESEGDPLQLWLHAAGTITEDRQSTEDIAKITLTEKIQAAQGRVLLHVQAQTMAHRVFAALEQTRRAGARETLISPWPER